MKRTVVIVILVAALMLSLAACGKAPASQNPAGAAEPAALGFDLGTASLV